MAFPRAYNLWGVLFCGVMAAFFGSQLIGSVYSHIRSSDWQPAKATVIGIDNGPKSADLRYRYVVDGIEFTGDTFAFLSEGSIPDKHLINDRYHVGDEIEVFVNPDSPSESVVERRTLHFKYIWTYVFIVGFNGFVAARCWHQARKEA